MCDTLLCALFRPLKIRVRQRVREVLFRAALDEREARFPAAIQLQYAGKPAEHEAARGALRSGEAGAVLEESVSAFSDAAHAYLDTETETETRSGDRGRGRGRLCPVPSGVRQTSYR